MCKKAKVESKVLKDRTRGLDSRGNHAMNTQAELTTFDAKNIDDFNF